MAKYILLILFCIPTFAFEKPKDLFKAMSDMEAFLNARKPVQADEVSPKFAEMTHLLSWAIEANESPKAKRVHAIVALAVAMQPFDQENLAANTIVADYSQPDMTALYDKELTSLPDAPSRNRLEITLHSMAENYREMKNGSR